MSINLQLRLFKTRAICIHDILLNAVGYHNKYLLGMQSEVQHYHREGTCKKQKFSWWGAAGGEGWGHGGAAAPPAGYAHGRKRLRLIALPMPVSSASLVYSLSCWSHTDRHFMNLLGAETFFLHLIGYGDHTDETLAIYRPTRDKRSVL